MPLRSVLGLALLGAAGAATAPAPADEFDRLEGAALTVLAKRGDLPSRDRLTVAEIGHLPAVLRGTRSALIVAVTDQGNPARLLVSAALRKPPGGGGEPVPVLVLERFATFEAGQATTRLARGQDLLLFDGFRVDLDAGLVVPDGQGGDLQFLARGDEGPRLVTLGGARMHIPAESPVPAPAGAAAGPSPGRAVLPGDFAGRYRLFANGQWSGTLELAVDAQGAVSGQFRSDLNGSTYPVAGQVAADVPRLVRFSVKYPRAQHDFEGYLWTEGKGAMAGSVTLLDRPYGFFALREGGRYAPEGEEVGPPTGDVEAPGRKVVEVRPGGRYVLDGKALDAGALTDALAAALAEEPATWVLLRVPGDLTFAGLARVMEEIRAAGISGIRLAPAGSASGEAR